jgi:Adenylylsulphate kinase
MWAIWITGLPGSGKTTIARAAAEKLRGRGVSVKIHDLDTLHKIPTCPVEVCAERERAARWGLTGHTRGAGPAVGVEIDLVLDYEPALAPELTIYTDVQDSATAAGDVLFVIERFRRLAVLDERRSPPCE